MWHEEGTLFLSNMLAGGAQAEAKTLMLGLTLYAYLVMAAMLAQSFWLSERRTRKMLKLRPLGLKAVLTSCIVR